MKKKLIALVAMMVALIAFGSSALAATGVSDAEQSLLDYGKKKATQYDVVDTYLFKAYYDEVSRYFAANDEDISADAAKAMLAIGDIEAAKIEKVLAEYNTTSLVVLHREHPQVWEDLWNEVRNDITPKALEYGIIVTADVKNHVFTLSDKKGNNITTGGGTIQWTGNSSLPTVATISTLVVLVAACVVVAYKKGLIGSKRA